jgi:hypothetical protein
LLARGKERQLYEKLRILLLQSGKSDGTFLRLADPAAMNEPPEENMPACWNERLSVKVSAESGVTA